METAQLSSMQVLAGFSTSVCSRHDRDKTQLDCASRNRTLYCRLDSMHKLCAVEGEGTCSTSAFDVLSCIAGVPVTTVKFDYSGQYLAAGGQDAHVYGVKQDWGLLATMSDLPKKVCACEIHVFSRQYHLLCLRLLCFCCGRNCRQEQALSAGLL